MTRGFGLGAALTPGISPPLLPPPAPPPSPPPPPPPLSLSFPSSCRRLLPFFQRSHHHSTFCPSLSDHLPFKCSLFSCLFSSLRQHKSSFKSFSPESRVGDSDKSRSADKPLRRETKPRCVLRKRDVLLRTQGSWPSTAAIWTAVQKQRSHCCFKGGLGVVAGGLGGWGAGGLGAGATPLRSSCSDSGRARLDQALHYGTKA